MQITQDCIKTDSMSSHKNCKQVATVSGMIEWLSTLIAYFSELCEPSYALNRKREKFILSAAAKRSFELFKVALVSTSVLAHLDYSLQFEVYCDASVIGLGANVGSER